MSNIGKLFPNLVVKAVDKSGISFDLNILKYLKIHKKKIILFWYPKDFTFVCPTELHAFENFKHEFHKRNCEIIGASCDTIEVHIAWLNSKKNEGGIEGINYKLISDSNRNLSSILGILDGITCFDENNKINTIKGDNITYRATYLIDENGLVFHESINHMPIGRNINEYLRLIDAYDHFQKYGEVCPANWEKGKTAFLPNKDAMKLFFNKKNK